MDDFLPFLEQSPSTTSRDESTTNATEVSDTTSTHVPLYPRTAHPAELWPSILTKAVLKIAALE